MPRILFLILCLCALQSCSAKFHTPEARRNTAFFLRDTTVIQGELLGIVDDSLTVLRSSRTEPDSLRSLTAIHFGDLDFVTFYNDASPLLNGALGLTIGAVLGGISGLAIGAATSDTSKPNWNALFGFLIGGDIGGIGGLILGITSATNKTVQIDRREDLKELAPFVRFKDAIELRRFRGY